jgi:hypothetical protein
MAANGGRSMVKRFTNSAARCCASAALPPFPKIRILCPEAMHLANLSAPVMMLSILFSIKRLFVRKLSSIMFNMMLFIDSPYRKSSQKNHQGQEALAFS